MTLIKDNIKIFNNCSDLPIYNFYSIIEKKDLFYLVKGYDGTNKSSFEAKVNEDYLSELHKTIINEYNELISNKQALTRNKLVFSLLEKQLTYEAAAKILNIYMETKSIEVLVLLNEFGFKIDVNKHLGKQIDRIIKKLASLRNKIRIDEAKFKSKYGKDSKDESNSNNILSRLDKEALSLELALELGYNINVKKTSVTRWINLISLADIKSKQYGRS